MRMIITGAGSGIGRAVAIGAARTHGVDARLFLVDLDADRLGAVKAELSDLGASASVLATDLALPESPEFVVSTALAALGGLDALVSNAGLVAPAPLTDMTVESFDSSMNLNARATWLLGKAAHGALRDSGGAIVATASISGTYPTPPLGAYSASKAALIMLIKQMALEWGPDGIRCNTVSPGPTLTGLTAGAFGGDEPAQRENRERREQVIPLRKVGRAEEVAEAILFLASPRASQITGIDVAVDGGVGLILMPASGGGSGPVGKAID
jgi:NAD(P)-dependent dehydrogenase (short-subunit alcohol dehydrogenase family)